MQSLTEAWQEFIQQFDASLQKVYADHGEPQERLFEAMSYSLNAGGKRLRPFLVYQFCKACGGEAEKAFHAALAVEMVHTYSPCRLNYRPEKAHCHVANKKEYKYVAAVNIGDGASFKVKSFVAVIACHKAKNRPQE